MKWLRRILILLAAVLLLPMPARAAGGSITVIHTREGVPVPDAQFALYRVEESLTDPQAAYAAILQASQKPADSGVTDADGKLLFSGLENGKYLLTGQPHPIGNQICEVEMSLLSIPGADPEGNPISDITVQPKFSLKEDTSEAEYRVMKLWEDSDNASRPSAIQVKLYRSGSLFSTVTLSRAGNWQYSWTESDPTATWTVVESVPEGYSAAYSREGNTFLITNTLQPDGPSEPTGSTTEGSQPSTTPSGPKLPQTGQLWWPVPVMALAGTLLFLLGCVRRKESRDEA